MPLKRYLNLWWALAKYALIREMAFRGNFLIKVTVEILWLLMMLIFYRAVFSHTETVARWNEAQYLFYLGCHYALISVLETLFLTNCGKFADLIRTGELDFYLLKPIDEQFLVSCRTVDWSTLPSIFMGLGLMIYSLNELGWPISVAALILFPIVFLSGIALAYGFLLMLSTLSIWMTRNQSLHEIWWLFTTLIRYPRDIFVNTWAHPIGWFFTFIIPIMLVVHVPASLMVQVVSPTFAGFSVVASLLVLVVSRKVFRLALKKYRSASS